MLNVNRDDRFAQLEKLREDVVNLKQVQKRILERIWGANSMLVILDKRTLQWVEDSTDIFDEIADAVAVRKDQLYINTYIAQRKGRKWIDNEQKEKIKKIHDKISKIDHDYSELLMHADSQLPINEPMIGSRKAYIYGNLSLGMKLCFLYFAAFPGDFKIEAKSLLRIWVAEKFIPYKETETFEETAECILEDLVKWRMVEVSHRFSDGSIKYCQVDDALRGFAIQKSKEINFLMVFLVPNYDQQDVYKASRVAVHYSDDNEPIIDSYGSPDIVRSLLLFGESSKVDCSKYKMLRVLANMRGEVKLEGFRGSSHLRYLQVNSAFNDRDFGEWIGGMKNLETLDLRLSMHGDLSNWIWRVETLRHVLLSEYYGETQGPLGSADLTNLQTLTGVYWSKSWKIFELAKLCKLHELGIFNYRESQILDDIIESMFFLWNVAYLKIQGVIDLKKLAMRGFQNCWKLKSLILINDDYNTDYTLDLRDGMLPRGLTELELGFQFGSDPMPALEKLESLITLRIRGARDIRNNPLTSIRCSAGGFKQLEELVLESLRLTEWEIEVGAMPRLERLNIRLCPLLKMPLELIKLESLQYLTCAVIKTSLYFSNRDEIRNIFEQRPHLQGGLREEFGDFIPFYSCF